MKHSLPVLVASKNEELAQLIREMLGKHGFFHVLETHNEDEALTFFREHASGKELAIIHHSLLTEKMMMNLRERKQFVVIAQSDDSRVLLWSAQLGVKHFLSFPFSSNLLLEKINEVTASRP